MEPHAELLCQRIKDNLRTLQDAATLDVGTPFVAHAQSHPAIAPVEEVGGCITGDTHQCVGSMVRLVFAIPIEGVAILQDAATMSVDVRAVIVGPKFAATDGLPLALSHQRQSQQKCQE